MHPLRDIRYYTVKSQPTICAHKFLFSTVIDICQLPSKRTHAYAHFYSANDIFYVSGHIRNSRALRKRGAYYECIANATKVLIVNLRKKIM